MLHAATLRQRHPGCDCVFFFARTKGSFSVIVGVSEQRDRLAPQPIRDRNPLCSTSLCGSRGGVGAADAASVEEEPERPRPWICSSEL